MRALDEARAVCETHLPGLLGELAEHPMLDLERPGNPGLQLFRKHGGPALVIPKEYGGLGIAPRDAVRVVRAIGACAPSLAVATAMHHFSVATVFTLADSVRSSGVEWALLEAIADQSLLMSSGFAEGNPAQGILTPTVTGTRCAGGIVVNGAKRPCSMARSMDLLSASVSVHDEYGRRDTVLVLVPRQQPGISVHPFWASDILAGAESDEVRLTDVFVDDKLILPIEISDRGELDELQTVGFIWFEMLITACYLGMASALVGRVLERAETDSGTIATLGIRLETAALLLDRIATLLTEKASGNAALTDAMIARYGAQDAICDAVGGAVEALGGVAFLTDPAVAYLTAASQCVRFHPPSRRSVRDAMAANLVGDILRLA